MFRAATPDRAVSLRRLVSLSASSSRSERKIFWHAFFFSKQVMLHQSGALYDPLYVHILSLIVSKKTKRCGSLLYEPHVPVKYLSYFENCVWLQTKKSWLGLYVNVCLCVMNMSISGRKAVINRDKFPAGVYHPQVSIFQEFVCLWREGGHKIRETHFMILPPLSSPPMETSQIYIWG